MNANKTAADLSNNAAKAAADAVAKLAQQKKSPLDVAAEIVTKHNAAFEAAPVKQAADVAGKYSTPAKELKAMLDVQLTRKAIVDVPECRTLGEFRKAIASSLDSIQSESIKVGTLLMQSKYLFASGADWESWVKNEFGLARAQAHKLVKVAGVFGMDARFRGVAMRVLYVLAQQDDAILTNKAAEAAKQGLLNTAWINAQLTPAAKPAPVKAEEQAPADASKGTPAQAPAAPANPAAPVPVVKAEPSQPAPEKAEQAPAEQSELARLTAIIEQQAREIARLTQALSEAGKAAAVLPIVPHLRSANPAIVLGLFGEVGVADVASRKRDLVKLYKGNNEAVELIVAAAESLTAQLS